ncbi:acyl-CoA dehydrogenase [Bordetella genomosp. 10]|uniref:Acyl-CoA dehydrogenase n=1 Tax=Bordetella genomosp. 10 TaxID=1416804 RepID=A0A261S4Z8_9BORD|nr:acyl-CoA dehydrogenase [Bordetella genomosp. 10]OZI31553.1 acyl-CoA dehydrogenase [Bordetella genomosp. 10]
MTTDLLVHRDDLDFLLYDMLDSEDLARRPRYADHGRETFDAAIDAAHRLAGEYFAPHNRLSDENEPRFDGKTVKTLPAVGAAVRAFAKGGFLAATHDYELGGMQLPVTISQSCLALFRAANVGSSAYCFLTAANANLIRAFGSEDQKRRFLPSLLDGRWLGTMALTEPEAGSSVPDLRTTATPLPDGRYAIKGQKIFISGGDHDISENIVHLVLARMAGAPAGAKGLSLFIVPKRRVDAEGAAGESNDVALAGLIHKMGYRGTTSTLLAFGENDACIGELVGAPGQGLRCMFHMMNEARIGVGMGATMLAYTGYRHALAYARERRQGRLPGNADPASPPVAIAEHADVRRMLLTQKCYVEGALSLCLYAARLADDEKTHPDASQREEAALLLPLLIPIVKSWPARYGLAANDLAIQVHGGYGYTREYPVEQFYRDNRLNALHEGTHGIQALDLLNRKVGMKDGQPLARLHARVLATAEQARASGDPGLAARAAELEHAWQALRETTEVLRAATLADPVQGSANAAYYLDLFGHHVIAWLWLWQAVTAKAQLPARPHLEGFYRGKLSACDWFFQTELALAAPVHTLLRGVERHALRTEIDWL